MSETTISKSFFDSHCHLGDSRFKDHLEEVLLRSENSGVREWMLGGIGPEDWDLQKEIKKSRPSQIHLSFGLHPWWIAEHPEEEAEEAFEKLVSVIPQADALGEVGLDFMPQFESSRQRQINYFEKQLFLNLSHEKPLVLHIVKAHSEVLTILHIQSKRSRAMVHGFTEGKEILKKYLELGFLISVGESVAKKGYRKLKECVSFIPIDQLVLETDAPTKTPNEPKDLIEVAKAVAELRRDLSATQLLEHSSENMQRFLNPQTK
jgi:TatD DNase family protein